jgi:hypothetical protein
MARILINVEKEDVKMCKIGCNFMIQCDNNIDLIFTPEAIEELINDYNKLKPKFTLGQNITVISKNLDTKIIFIEWDNTKNTWKYCYENEDGFYFYSYDNDIKVRIDQLNKM